MKIKFFNIAKKASPQKNNLLELQKNLPSFCKLPREEELREISSFAKKNKKWQHILIIGIGGSALPPRTLIEAIPAAKPSSSNYPKFHFLDNLDPTKTTQIFAQLDWKKTLVIVITKSGNTLETLSNFFVVQQKLGENWQKQVVTITDPEKGFLRKLSAHEKLQTFEIPPEIGGRFSIFTAVGLIPAALANLDLQKLLTGAKSAKTTEAFRFAQIHASEYSRKKNITSLCVYSNALETFTKWWEQLLAESIGKSNKIGITPQTSIGTNAQHSLLQLWSEGPDDKFFIFLKTKKSNSDLRISNPHADFKFLRGKSMQQILNIEMQTTVKSLVEKKRAMAEIEIDKLDEKNLGHLLQFWMLETYFLGKILQINPFDQPGVERGKILTRKLLAKN